MNDAVADAVTALFVPGDRPDRYGKAVASGADIVIIDLEDAVAPQDKGAARDAVAAALRPRSGARAGSRQPTEPALRALVRINDPQSPPGAADLAMLAALAGEPGHGLIGVMVPKAGRVDALAAVIEAVVGVPAPRHGPEGLAVIALIESALGVAQVRTLAALPGLTRLAFGALDFALDVGADVGALTGQLARAEVVIASRAAGLGAPLESPSTSLSDAVLIEEYEPGRTGTRLRRPSLRPPRAARRRTRGIRSLGRRRRLGPAHRRRRRLRQPRRRPDGRPTGAGTRPLDPAAHTLTLTNGRPQKLPMPLPTRVTPMTSSSTAITVALLCTSQPRRDSSGLAND